MKKLISVLLCVVMAFGLTFGASAAVERIKSINEANFQKILEDNMKKGKVSLDKTTIADKDKLARLSVKSGSELRIYLTPDMFLDADGKPAGLNDEKLTSSNLNLGKITMRVTGASEPAATEQISLAADKTGAFIKVSFIDPFVSISQRDFEFTLYLNVNGARKNSTKIYVAGTLANKRENIYSGDDYADLSDGTVVIARDNVRNVEFYLGNYVSITLGSIIKNKAVCGAALTDVSKEDEKLIGKYPEIEYVYSLKTIGLKTVGDTVSFDLDGTYYVYNTNGNYIGTSNRKLPYWQKYYLSTKKYASLEA